MNPEFFENVILQYLFKDKTARTKILPFLDGKIFDVFENKEIVKGIKFFEGKYNKFPTVSDLKLHLQDKEVYSKLVDVMNLDISEFNDDSLMGEVEDFFKKKLIWNVVAETAENLKEDDIEKIKVSPDDLRTALSFSFDTKIGLDLFENPERMYDFYHDTEKVVSSGLRSIDKWIEGGFHEKSLSVLVAQTNLGKTIFKCSMASSAILQNKNVLYITFEMSEEKIGERIIQNVFDMKRDDLYKLTKDKFIGKYNQIKDKIKHSLHIKEYPTKSANTNSLRNLLKELEMKSKFKPDIIFVDYLGIMNPIFMLKSDNTYTEGKRITEELRGLSVEMSIPIVSSVQSNRGGFESSELDLTNVADSIGTAQGADLIIGLSQPEGFKEQNLVNVVILKNRYGPNKIKASVNIDYLKMRITDADDNPTEQIEKRSEDISNATNLVANSLSVDKKEKSKKIINFE